MRPLLSASLIALVAATPFAVAAQDAEPAAQADPQGGEGTFTENEILVIAGRIPGQVDSPSPPILELNEADIAAYGAGSIAELLEQLSTQTGSGRGRGSGPPVFLVNGMRVSSFREMSSYPPEAIRKVEVLPEEVSQRFGFSPDQRVINFILKDNFSSREIEAEFEQPDRGGYSVKELEATYLLITGTNRFNLNAEINDTTLLTEAERGVIQAQGSVPGLAGDPDPASYRSLVSDSTDYELTGNWSTRLAENGTALSLNGAFSRNDRLSLQGLDSVLLTDPLGDSVLRTLDPDNPLRARSRTDTWSFGSTLNAPLGGGWQFTGTVDANLGRSRSRTDRYGDTSALVAAAAAGTLALDADLGSLPDAGYDEARSKTYTLDSLVTVVGSPFELPAGEVMVTLDSGFKANGIDSEDTRNPGIETSLSRRRVSGGINIGIPLTSRDLGGLGAIGDITLNLNGGLDHLSDFGTLTDWTVGLNWNVTDKLGFNASYIAKDEAPSLTQLGAAEIATPNVSVYDISRGETVLATVVTGGNPLLPAQSQRDWKIGASWELPLLENSRLTVDYFKNHSEDVASSFPLLTPEIEAAFPDRVTRDSSGRLLALDQRPVTFAETSSQRLAIGLNLSGPLGKPRPEAANTGGGGFAFGGGGAPGASGPSAGGFDPQAFEALRNRFCMPEMASAVPTAADLAALPEFLVNRLKNEDGTIDPERWAEFKGRLCSGEGPVIVGGGPGGGGFDPARFAELRRQFCSNANSEEMPSEEVLAVLPAPLLERLKRPDGTIDPEQWKQFRQRICAASPQGGAGQGGAPEAGGPGGGAPVFVFRGPGGGGGGGGPRGGGGFRMMGGGGPGGGGNGQGRWFIGFNHTIELSSTVLVAPGGPVLDLLGGDALSSSQPRHSTQMRGGLFYRGFGFIVGGSYTGSSYIEGSGLPGSTDLYFDDIARFDVRLFVDLNQRESLVEAVPLLRNTRVTFSIDNLFDARQRVTDGNGDVPLRYQPYLIDPTGRFIGVEFRKLF